jgi:hypothetical protein
MRDGLISKIYAQSLIGTTDVTPCGKTVTFDRLEARHDCGVKRFVVTGPVTEG